MGEVIRLHERPEYKASLIQQHSDAVLRVREKNNQIQDLLDEVDAEIERANSIRDKLGQLGVQVAEVIM